MSKIYTAKKQYPRAIIFAPGSSLTFNELAACFLDPNSLTIAVGNAHLYAKTSNILYHSDAKWWNHHNGHPDFAGKHKICLQPTLHKDVQLVENAGILGLSLEQGKIFSGQNSGYAAINLAVLHGVKEIILLGYDMKYGSAKKDNFCGNHPKGVSAGYNPNKFIRFIQNCHHLVKPLAELGVNVYNCSEGSALDCFPKVRLKDVL